MPRLYFRKATARTEIVSGCFGNRLLRTFGHWSRGPAARTPFVVPSPATLGHRTSTRGGNDNGELPIAYEDFLQIWPASSDDPAGHSRTPGSWLIKVIQRDSPRPMTQRIRLREGLDQSIRPTSGRRHRYLALSAGEAAVSSSAVQQ